MGHHEEYGTAVMRQVSPGAFIDVGREIEASLGSGYAKIDGVVGDIAIEIEARVPKQVRGAIVDLLLHDAPKKLLILLPPNLHNADLCGK